MRSIITEVGDWNKDIWHESRPRIIPQTLQRSRDNSEKSYGIASIVHMYM